MSFTTPSAVPSATACRVLQVNGRRPVALTDFEGDVAFVLDLGDGYLVSGAGRAHGDLVRFHEKDVEHNGKDIRVWHVRQDGADFLAEQAATF